MNRLFCFLALLFLPGLASAGDISQIIFTNSSLTVKPDEAALLTIQMQYDGDSHPTVCMEVFTDSSTGRFSSSNTNWRDVNKLTINSNWTNKNFYYKDSTLGNYILTAKVIPVSCSLLKDEEAQWIISQNIVVSDQNEDVQDIIQEVDYIPPEELPKIKAHAGKDKIVIAGVSGEFRGEAFGLDDGPIDNARYLWNFGDGATKEGRNVTHSYFYPGEYSVYLDVSSGGYSALDKVDVKVIPNSIFISEIKTGVDSFVELSNNSAYEIDISGWKLSTNNSFFIFPQNSFIKPKSYLVLPFSSSGMVFSPEKGSVELFYPGSFLAGVFKYQGVLKERESFSRESASADVFASLGSPGMKNNPAKNVAAIVKEEPTKEKNEITVVNSTGEQAEEQNMENQIAGVAFAGEKNIFGGKVYYFVAVIFIALFSGVVVFLVRRKGGV